MSDADWLALLMFTIVFTVAFLFFMLWLSFKGTSQSKLSSPYSGLPLRRGQDLSNDTKRRVHQYLESLHQFDNRPFSFQSSLFCRETGRIFPDCKGWFGWRPVGWQFLNQYYPGHYVSWGSLPPDHQREIREAHVNIIGYQTKQSSTQPSPKSVEPEYAFLKPGPLYVDLQTKVLLGWKQVPETDLEVLVVQKPGNL